MNNFYKFRKYVESQGYIENDMGSIPMDFDIVEEYYKELGVKNSNKILNESENMYLINEKDGGIIFTQNENGKIKKLFMVFEQGLFQSHGSIYICHEISHYIYIYNRLNNKLKDNPINFEILSYFCEHDFSKKINKQDNIERYRYNYNKADIYTYSEVTSYMIAYYYLNFLKEQDQDKLRKYMKNILNGKIDIQELIEDYKLNYNNNDILETNIEHVKKLNKKNDEIYF